MTMGNLGGGGTPPPPPSKKRGLFDEPAEDLSGTKRSRKEPDRFGDPLGHEAIDELYPPTPEELALFAQWEDSDEDNIRSGGGFSGEARCDATQPTGYSWNDPNPRILGLPKAGHLRKRTWLNIKSSLHALRRDPNQPQVMWDVESGKVHTAKKTVIDDAKKANKKPIRGLSANLVMGYNNYKNDPKASYEWLHLVANSLGGPDYCSFVAPSKITHKGTANNRAQVLGNLVLGTYSANTFMIAIESMVDLKPMIHYCVDAYSATDVHVADWIRVSVCKSSANHGEPIGINGAKCRHYWIDAKMQVCPRKTYDHMKADVKKFVEDDSSYQTTSTYVYPPLSF